jgi:hypothetical protein
MPAFVDARADPDREDLLLFGCPIGLDGRKVSYVSEITGPSESTVRLVAQGRTGIEAVIELLGRLPEEGVSRAVIVEILGPIEPEAARRITTRRIPLVLAADRPTRDCGDADSDDVDGSDSDPFISGVIAITPEIGGDLFLAAAARRIDPAERVQLTPQEALEAITVDAAAAIGVENERGVIAQGRRADFAVLDRNPLTTPGEAWAAIRIEPFIAAQ